jgi:hypothetical protein
MNQKINSNILADLLNIKPKPGTFIQRLKHDMKDNNFNMDDQIILINNPFQNEQEEEEEEPSSMPLSMPLSSPLSLPLSLPLPMIYQEQEPSSMPMIYQEQEPSSVSMPMPLSSPLSLPLPMMYKEQEPLPCKENELILDDFRFRAEIHLRQQQGLIKQQQELIKQQQEQLNAYKKENIHHTNHITNLPHKKHKKTVRFQLIPFHTKLSKKKTRRATPLPRRSSSLSQKFLKL